MDQDLISKKDLLELANISYGQLYRWKRKQLIPEDWFIRKSTFTGQETFFPREKILARIEKIKQMKDDLSLDSLADVFSPVPSEIALSVEDLLSRNIVSKHAVDLYVRLCGGRDHYSFRSLLHMFTLDRLLRSGDISLDEGAALLQTLEAHFDAFKDAACDLILTRKLGVSTFAIASPDTALFFEEQAKVVVRVSLAAELEALKLHFS